MQSATPGCPVICQYLSLYKVIKRTYRGTEGRKFFYLLFNLLRKHYPDFTVWKFVSFTETSLIQISSIILQLQVIVLCQNVQKTWYLLNYFCFFFKKIDSRRRLLKNQYFSYLPTECYQNWGTWIVKCYFTHVN